MKRRPPVLAMVVSALALVVLFLLRKALAPFFVAAVLAYLLTPLVTWLDRYLRREWAVLSVLVTTLGLAVGALFTVLPMVWGQFEKLVLSIPSWKDGLVLRLSPWLNQHPQIQAKVNTAMAKFDPMVLLQGLQSAGTGLLSLFLNAMALILVPLILYYLLLEGPRLMATLDDLVPNRHRPRVRAFVRSVHHRMGGYIRGQLAVSAVMSLLQGFGFWIMGVPHAWLLGMVAGVSNFVPYFPYVSALPAALILAALAGAGGGKILFIVLVFTLIQKAETLYFTPVWVGRATKLHPLEVLLALLCFGFAFGVLGLVFAVPLMILLKAAMDEFIEDYKAHPWFAGETQP